MSQIPMKPQSRNSAGAFISKVQTAQENAALKTSQYWYNMDKNKHYVINENGSQGNSDAVSHTMYRGFKRSNLLQRSAEKKGERIMKAAAQINGLPEYKDQEEARPPTRTYIPANNKFEGYCQFRCPLVKSNIQSQDALVQMEQRERPKSKGSQFKSNEKVRKVQSILFRQKPRDSEDKVITFKDEAKASQNDDGQNNGEPQVRVISTPRYFHRQRPSQDKSLLNQSKMLSSYIKYLEENSQSSKKPQVSQSLIINPSSSVIKGAQEVNDESSILKIDSIERNCGSRLSNDHRRLIELSRRIIRNKQRQKELQEPPLRAKEIGPECAYTDVQQSPTQVKRYNDSRTIMQSKTGASSSFHGSNSQRCFLYTVDLFRKSHDAVSNKSNSEGRYRSFASMKAEKTSQTTIKDYQQLRHSHIGLISRYLKNPNRLEDDLNERPNTICHSALSLEPMNALSLTPQKIKTVHDFKSPFIEREQSIAVVNHSKKSKKERLSTKGLFLDTQLKDGEIVTKEEKANFMKVLNPDIVKLLKRKEELELKKLKFKKEAKVLQAMSVEQEMRIKDRQIYKSFIKYPF